MRKLALAAMMILGACSMSEGGGNEQAAAGPREVAPVLSGEDARDTRSFARPEVARVTHVALDLDADFQAKRMAGTAILDIQAAEGAQEIVLDSKGLEIQAVTDGAGAALQHALGAGDEARGRPLTVRITPATRQLRIR